jgi:rhodanese-related sulfurtransferase
LIFDVVLVDVVDAPDESKDSSVVNIDNTELKNLILKKIPLIDLRRPDEWKSTGIIKGSITLTLYDTDGRPLPNFVPELIKLGLKDKPFILICRTGNRTAIAATGLTESLGFSKVYNVEKGIVGWLSDNNPVVKFK